MVNIIRKKLFEMADEKYKKFHSGLCPNVDNIIGVRTPILRDYAKELITNNRIEEIQIGDRYYEELVLQGMIIGLQKNEDINKILTKIEEFVPKINSWAVCDIFCAGLKITNKNKEKVLEFLQKYLKSNKEYELRFAIVMLLDYYINDIYIDMVLETLEKVKSDKYYVQMAVAWAYSICIIKYYNKSITSLEKIKSDRFTYNKALQKAIESYRISNEKKQYLRNMKS